MGADAAVPDSDTSPSGPSSTVHARRNFVLGALSRAIGTTAYDFIHPDLIVAGLIYTLTLPVFGRGWALALVAVVSMINKGGSLLPQLYVSSRLEHHARKRPFYLLLMGVRLFGAVTLLVAIHLLATRVDALALGLFLAAFLIISFCWGAGHIVTLDMVGRMIPFGQMGSFFGIRDFLGGLFSLVAGMAVVQPILSRGGEARDGAVAANYFWLAVIGTVLAAVSMSLFAMCREGAGPRAKRRTTVGESLLRGWRWLKRNPDYRAYLWLRIAFRFNYLAMTFFIPYGEQKLRSSGDVAGIALLGGVMVATFKLSRLASSAVWGWMADARGDRAVLIGAGVGFALAPALALVAPVLPEAFRLPIPMTRTHLDLPLLVYLAALVGIGAAFQASIIGGNRFLVGRAPPRRRLSYVGFLNTVTSPLTLLPLAAAGVAGYFGMTTLFAAIVVGGLLYLFWAVRMRPETGTASARRRGGSALPAGMGDGGA